MELRNERKRKLKAPKKTSGRLKERVCVCVCVCVCECVCVD